VSAVLIWQWGMAVFATLIALVWLCACRPVRWRTSAWLVAGIVAWPLVAAIAMLALVLVATEIWREAIHDDFWRQRP